MARAKWGEFFVGKRTSAEHSRPGPIRCPEEQLGSGNKVPQHGSSEIHKNVHRRTGSQRSHTNAVRCCIFFALPMLLVAGDLHAQNEKAFNKSILKTRELKGQGKLRAAEEELKNAFRHAGPNRAGQAQAYLERADLYRRQHMLATAYRDLEIAIKKINVRPIRRDLMIGAHATRADIFYDQGQYALSEADDLVVIAQLQKLPQNFTNQASLRAARHDLGCLYLNWNREGDLGRATEQIEAAYKARQRWLMANRDAPDEDRLIVLKGLVESEYRLAHIALQRNEFNKAKDYVASQFKRLNLIGDPPPALKYNAHYQHAIIDWHSKNQARAIGHLTAAIDISSQMRQKVGFTSFERSAAQTQMLTASQRLMEYMTELGKPNEVFLAMETARGQGFSEDLQMDRAALRESTDRTFIPARKQLEFDVDTILVGGRQAESELKWAKLGAAYQAYREARADILEPKIAGQRATPRNAKQDLANLTKWAAQNDALVLEYLVCPDKSYLVAITPDQTTKAYDLKMRPDQRSAWGLPKSDTANPLTAGLLDKLWTSETDKGIGVIFSRPRDEAVTPEQRKLTQELTSRLAALLLPSDVQSLLKTRKFKRILVIPDGRLAMLPFDVLRIKQDDDSTMPLIELDIPFIYAPSADVFLTLVERSQKKIEVVDGTKPILLVSKSTFTRHNSPNMKLWTDLAYVSRQSIDAKNAFQDLLEHADDIGETTCRTLLHQQHRQFVSIATHGQAYNEFENVFGSIKLKIVDRKDQRDNGTLEMLDVACMDLTGCQMVMLTVCKTNLGPTVSGEIPLGFSRSFLAAGASRVVSANWDVDDYSAAIIADHFNKSVASQLQANDNDFSSVDYALALHTARKARFDVFDAPQDWAPLVHIGP